MLSCSTLARLPQNRLAALLPPRHNQLHGLLHLAAMLLCCCSCFATFLLLNQKMTPSALLFVTLLFLITNGPQASRPGIRC